MLGLAALAGVFAAAMWLTADLVRRSAIADLAERSGHVLSLVNETLRGELAKHQSTPFLIAHNPEIAKVVMGTAAPEELRRANENLQRLAEVTSALDIYLMNSAGTTVAASNFSSPRSFIGQNFSYRPYFTEAMKGRLGRYFAVGTTSGERGYYFANPIFDGRYVVGVAVVKLRVDHLEQAWRASDHDIVVTDDDGVVFLSSRPEWRLRTLEPLSEAARRRIAEHRRYDGAPLTPLTLATELTMRDSSVMVDLSAEAASPAGPPQPAGTTLLMQRQETPDAGWTVAILTQTGTIERQVATALALLAITLTSLLLAAANIHQRRRRLNERLHLQECTKAELERRVTERTEALTDANVRLEAEVAERRRAEAELIQAQSELVQASKLAALGQMSAGLSHELNQPLAAIRSYADNARVFLSRGRTETASSNLSAIVELTERMARIIRHLRTYARKEPTTLVPTSVGKSINEAIGLLQRRLDEAGVTIEVELAEPGIKVIGGEVRLQQVFVNLIGNAIDAMHDADVKRIAVAVRPDAGGVVITVTDTGPGISPENLASVFDPFFTTKDVGAGLGLGLSITYGIVKQFGGSISAANAPAGGAMFEIRLVAAEPALETAA